MKRSLLHSCAFTIFWVTATSIAVADSISSYTVTDLGPLNSSTSEPNISNTGADGTITSTDGKTYYAFPRTDNHVSSPQPLLDTFPPFTNAPVHASMTYGDPKAAYSYFDTAGVFLNKAGEFVATDLIGVNGHVQSAASAVFSATRQGDGTFGPLSPLWGTPDNAYSGGKVALALDLNNSGLVLGDGYNSTRFLYDLHSRVWTDIASLLPTGWHGTAIAIDDRGRILVDASPSARHGNDREALLLTPGGISSDPIATPEPSTFVTLAIAGAGWVIRRRWKKSKMVGLA